MKIDVKWWMIGLFALAVVWYLWRPKIASSTVAKTGGGVSAD